VGERVGGEPFGPGVRLLSSAPAGLSFELLGCARNMPEKNDAPFFSAALPRCITLARSFFPGLEHSMVRAQDRPRNCHTMVATRFGS